MTELCTTEIILQLELKNFDENVMKIFDSIKTHFERFGYYIRNSQFFQATINVAPSYIRQK